MGYVGQEKLLSNGVFEIQGTFPYKHLSRFYLARPLTVGVFFSTSPIEGNTYIVFVSFYSFHNIHVVFLPNLSEKCPYTPI